MGTKTTTLILDEDDVRKARELNINLSEEIRKYMKILIGEVKKPVPVTEELREQIDNFISDINTSELLKDNWRAMLIGRCRLIKSKIGVDIGPIQLEQEITKRFETSFTKSEIETIKDKV